MLMLVICTGLPFSGRRVHITIEAQVYIYEKKIEIEDHSKELHPGSNLIFRKKAHAFLNF